MKTFKDFLNENYLDGRIIKSAKMIIKFCLGEAYIDDEVLDVTDNADEITFSDGKMNLYFTEQQNAVETFKKLASMFGSEIKNDKFSASAGITGELKNYNYYMENNGGIKITEAVSFLHKTFKSLEKLKEEGYIQISREEALEIMNGNKITEHVYSLKYKRNENGEQCWYKGPNVEVFSSIEDSYRKYTYSSYKFNEDNVINMHDYTFDSLMDNDGVLFFVKNGSDCINDWTLVSAKKVGVQY